MMARSLYISPKAKNVGSLFVSLGFMQRFSKTYKKVAFFKPIVLKEDDYSIAFMKQRYALMQDRFFGFTLNEAIDLIEQGREDELFLSLIDIHHKLLEKFDFVLYEGVARDFVALYVDTKLDLKISQHLSSAIINVVDNTTKLSDDEYLATIVSKTDPLDKRKNSLAKLDELDRLSGEDIFEEMSLDILKYKTCDIKEFRVLEDSIDEVCDGDLVVLSAKRKALLDKLLKSDKKPAFLLITSSKDTKIGEVDFAVASTALSTIEAIKELLKIKPRLRVNDTKKIDLALELFNSSIDIDSFECNITTPLAFEYKLRELAKKHRKKILLVDSKDERVIKAAKELEGVVECLFLDDIKKDEPLLNKLSQELYRLRKHKGLSLEASKELLKDPNYFATMMVYMGFVDGMVSGAKHSSADVIRPALKIIGVKKDTLLVSSMFFMCLEKEVVVFADCALNQNPNAKELAQIAISAAKSASYFGIEPRVAMLSYSTKDSGSGVDVELVKDALKVIKQREPNLLVDGPMQYDVAVDKSIAKAKNITSLVGGDASVFIFADLNSGNTTYKAVQRSAKAIAIGPILLGLDKPINDLSRGASVKDIVNTILVSAIQGGEV
ncbi:MAG: phosphate acetyltransferase [Sulfurimonas sp.]|jgi:phosphate acetyltransferase|nr:phosphate acetyltransferase [Sulfurimonadaceae bacterium]